MTIAYSRRQMAEGLAEPGFASTAPISLAREPHPVGRPDALNSPPIPHPSQSPIAAPPRVSPMRQALRALVKFAYHLMRPLLRPMAWRMRGFLQQDVLAQLHAIRVAQDSLAASLAVLLQHGAVPGGAPVDSAANRPKLRRKIHQFHAGSATGDAITNAMLLIQRRLRAMGYDSEIFVEHLAPGLEHALHKLSALPMRDDHVLLVHHSMGHAGIDHVLASKAPKVLIYHNITPPELLAFNPFLQQAAELGRRQLLLWRDHTVAALADSAFNGMELRRLGFDHVRESTLLFDVDHLIANAKPRDPRADAKPRDPRADAKPYTVLFVGREVPSKGQTELVDAFACFARAFAASSGRTARLVLAGAGASAAASYRADLLQKIAAHGLHDQISLTGALSDDALHACYAAADLYVSLSRHEGFGVPLIEAMAYDVPVIALRAGAVAATLGEAGMLIDSAAPELVAEAMLSVAQDPEKAAAIIKDQRRNLARWRLDRHLPALQQALSLAGAAPPSEPECHHDLIQGIHVALSGDADAVTLAWDAIDSVLPGRVRHGDIPRDHSGPLVSIAFDGAPPPAGEQPDLALALIASVPEILSRRQARALNLSFDALLVGSRAEARMVVESGVRRPIRIVGDHFGEPPWAMRVVHHATDLMLARPSQPLRIAWLSPWGVRCGIAEYSRHLLQAFDRTTGDELLVLSDQRETLSHMAALDGITTTKAFRIGDAASVPDLADDITMRDPDVLVIQHQPGVLPWAALADLLEHKALTRRCVVITLHNARDLTRCSEYLRERVTTALASASRILVHSAGDVSRLGDLGLNNAVWLPHGTTTGPEPRRASMLLSGDTPVIGTTGFVLPHKGLQALIRAIALLRRHWPGLTLRLVTARYLDPVSDIELAACKALVQALGLSQAVEWHTDFAANDIMLQRLSDCDLVVMPYAPTLESSSGAVRQAIASGAPTLVSDISLFDDLGDAVDRLPDTTPEAIAERIDHLLRKTNLRAALQDRAQDWLQNHDWSLIAERLQGMLHGLHAEHRQRWRPRL